MKILITGGSGDLGQLVGPSLASLGHSVSNLDIKDAPTPYGEFIPGSVLDRTLINETLPDFDGIVHIAALHGIHEFRKSATAEQFWDVNVTGTFNLLNGARIAGVRNFIFLSSTSVDDSESFYGHTKVLAEEACKSFSVLEPEMSIIRLRPRAFIPHWNRAVYSSFVEWAEWFWKGAVHINDVAQAVIKSVTTLERKHIPGCPVLVLDGKYDYTESELESWDQDGPGSTFRRRYGDEMVTLAEIHGLKTSLKPNVLVPTPQENEIGWYPTYSISDLLMELKKL
jgi:nucleoside-diphosphate-sugar epimerase